jgi:hypothetical protein
MWISLGSNKTTVSLHKTEGSVRVISSSGNGGHTWASRQRLTVAMGEWHQDAYKATNRSRPPGVDKVSFRRALKSASSGAVKSIKLSACSRHGFNLSVLSWGERKLTCTREVIFEKRNFESFS